MFGFIKRVACAGMANILTHFVSVLVFKLENILMLSGEQEVWCGGLR